MSISDPCYKKIRLFLWLTINLIIVGFFIKMLGSGSPLNTNVLDLLPNTHQTPVVQKASHQFAQRMGRQLLFLVGNADKKTAQNAADLLEAKLSEDAHFQSVKAHIKSNQQKAWGSFYFPFRFNLLTSQQRHQLEQGHIQAIEKKAIFNLYNPMGISSSDLLKKDPYFLFQDFITTLPKPAEHIQLIDGFTMAYHQDQWYVLVRAQLNQDSFSITNQTASIQTIDTATRQIQADYKDTTILKTGMLFYANAGTQQAQSDISIIGIGSIIGIILLILLTFRSLTPLMFILLSTLVGFLAAFVITWAVFGSVYLFTLVFGASLIGISVDYAFFYYSEQLLGGTQWQPDKGLQHIFPGITLGLLNILIAYAIIAFTPFPGLQQLAVFAIAGLTMAYATVVCLFPFLLKAKRYAIDPPLLLLTNRFLRVWQGINTKTLFIGAGLLSAFVIIGISQIQINDDIKILQSVPSSLKTQEHKIKTIIGSHFSTNFFIVRGKSPQKTLANAKQLTQEMASLAPEIHHPYLAITDYIPTIDTQKKNFQLVKEKLIKHHLTPYLAKIGVDKPLIPQIKQSLSSEQFQPLTIKKWLHSPVSNGLSYLWLGQMDQSFVTIVLPSNQLPVQNLQSLTDKLPSVTYINKAQDISQVFKIYRNKLTWFLGVAFVALFLLLIIRYSFKSACLTILPPLSACLTALAGLGWLGLPLTLFNILALILVLGIAVDYVLFFKETRSKYTSTMLASTLSAITTILSFGLLTFSQTDAVAFFGVTVLVGISCAYILAPLVLIDRSKRK